MGTIIKRDLPNDEYQAAVGANSPSISNVFATIADLPLTNSGGTQLLTGGASWSGTGMVFDVTVLTYQIAGVNYTSAATSVTLAVGDPSDPRFDAIVVDEFGVVSVITGTPSSNPITPTIPGEQVLVQYILVNAGAITPNITDEWVYRESQFADWQGSLSSAGASPTANFSSSSPAPFDGAACLLATYTAYSNARYIQFLAPAPIDRSTYVGLSLRVYLTVDLTTLVDGPRRPWIRLRGGPSSSLLGTRYLDAHGLDPTLVGVWQQVTIPTLLYVLNPGVTDIRLVDLSLQKATDTPNPPVNIAYDNIVFQTGFGTTSPLPTIDILENGNVIGSTGKLNFIDGTGINITPLNDTANNKIDLLLNATGVVEPFFAIGGVTLADYDNLVFTVMDSSGGANLTIPNNAVVPIPIGYTVRVTNIGTLNTGIVAAAGVTYYAKGGGTQINGQYGVITLTKLNIDEWIIDGDLI